MDWLQSEYWLEIDQALFILINRSWQNSFFDYLLPWWRNKYFWIPAYILFTVFLLKKLGRNCLPVFLVLICTVVTSDLCSSLLIKESIQRIRPCNDPVFKKQVFLRAACGSGYSFTSSHAANHAGIAVFLFLAIGHLLKNWRYLLLLWAVSIGFAQIYVGVHYPLDILGGFLVGSLAGFLAYLLSLKWFGTV